MNNLIRIEQKDGELYADSRMVAQVLGIEHDSISKIIREKESLLGISRFEIGEIKGRGKPEKYYLLTERQSLLLITMVRNSAEALEAKTGLVDAFLAMRKELGNQFTAMVPKNYKEALLLAIRQQEQIEVLGPKAKALDVIANAEGLTTVKEVAKRLGVGEKVFWAWLHDQKIIFRSNGNNIPYQTHINSGYMTTKEHGWKANGKTHIHPQPLFTAKGLAWISTAFVNRFSLEAV